MYTKFKYGGSILSSHTNGYNSHLYLFHVQEATCMSDNTLSLYSKGPGKDQNVPYTCIQCNLYSTVKNWNSQNDCCREVAVVCRV